MKRLALLLLLLATPAFADTTKEFNIKDGKAEMVTTSKEVFTLENLKEMEKATLQAINENEANYQKRKAQFEATYEKINRAIREMENK